MQSDQGLPADPQALPVRFVKLIVEYEGTKFSGLQWQKNSRTVQGELEKALTRVMQEPVRILAAGRTDAGVHATGQTVKFQTVNRIPIDRVPYALNSVLPSDLRVRRAERTNWEFHPRFDAKSRVYRYRIDNKPFRSVLMRRFSHHVPRRLEVAAMQRAAESLIGVHDFVSFEASGSNKSGSTIRELTKLGVRREGGWVLVTVEANAFLYRMVRNIVGTLILVGLGEMPPERVGEILDGRNRGLAGPTAPPQGLCLVRVRY